MTFLNLLLIGGMAAVSAPIIIHLLHRSKVTTYDWGAMMFLEDIMASEARRLRMHELLLLIVRALIVAFLVLALMRPLLNVSMTGKRAAGVHTSSLLLIDDSYSMNAGRPRTAWQEAQDQALKYIETLHKGDEVTVLFASSAGKGAPPAALMDLERVGQIIRQAKPQAVKVDMPRALTAALQSLDGRHNPQRELVVVTDMQASGWELQDRARWSFISNSIRTSRVQPKVFVLGVHENLPRNIAVTSVTPSRVVVDPYSAVTFSIAVVNHGVEPIKDVNLQFFVDGAPKNTKIIELPAGGREVLAFEHKFDRPGSHYVTARAQCAQDVLSDDDEVNYSVLVIDKLPVLVVDGDRRNTVFTGESGFLKLALAPKDDDDPTWRTVIEPTIVDPTELRYSELSRYRAVILANVAALPGAVVSELERFVIAGGGLFVAVGNRVQPDVYNRDLYRQGSGLLPVPLERVAGINTAIKIVEGVASPQPVHLAAINSDVPGLEMFRPEKGQDWSKASIRTYFTTKASVGRDDVRTIASYSDGAPFLIQKKMGEGKILLFTTAVDSDWSDMPLHPFYVPLMQNLILNLASAVSPPRNVHVGETLSFVASGDAARKAHILHPPKGEPHVLKAQRQGSLAVFSHEMTGLPGVYSVSPEGGGPDARVFYAVGADRNESNLARLKADETKIVERDLDAKFATTWEALSQHIGLGAAGVELSEFLIMAATLLCFLEIYLTRRWA